MSNADILASDAPVDDESSVEVRTLQSSDEPPFLTAVRASTELHGDWYSTARSPDEFRERLARRDQVDYLFLYRPTGQPCGIASISNIVRRGFQSGYLSFAAFTPHAGRGLMTAALRQVVVDAFTERQLHRLEANVQPGNAPSIALIERLGFRLEGRSPRYLHIAGAWRDHDRFAITAEEIAPHGRASPTG